MAGDWMKIELELPDKPEVHAIASMLNIDPDCVVGKLIRVWQWFDKHTTDGNAYGVTYSLPDRISGVTGFGEAMSFVGWLEQNDKTLSMPKFDRHTSASAKARALTAKRVDKNRSKSNADSNADTVTESVTSPLAREEKRREDISTSLCSVDKTATAKRLPADWTPSDDDIAFCKAKRPDLDANDVAERFRDHWIAQPGAKGRKLDWSATWRNWVRNEKRQNAPQKTQHQLNQEGIARSLGLIPKESAPWEKVIEGEIV